jgi:hypothetical protein
LITIILVDVHKLSNVVIISRDASIFWMGIPLSIMPLETIIVIWRIIIFHYVVISHIVISIEILVVVLTIVVVVRACIFL